MKYFSRLWANEYDGVLFFVQRLEEMLFHYSQDIVRAPVHSTQTLLEEYVHERHEVQAKRVREYQLIEISKELKESIISDRVLIKRFGQEFIERVSEWSDTDRDDIITYLANKVGRLEYVEWCTALILEEVVDPKHKKEIEKVLRLWIASILWHGYSPEYVYSYLHKIFDNATSSPLNMLEEFLKHFDFEEHKYDVYFVFYKAVIPYKEQFTKRLKVTFIAEEQYFELYKKKKNQSIGYVSVNSLDECRAIETAAAQIDVFVRFYKVISNRKSSFIDTFGLVINLDTQQRSIRPTKSRGLRSIEWAKEFDVGEAIDFTVFGCMKKSSISRAKIDKLISLHNTAIHQSDLRDGFINLWSVLEVVAIETADENKIEKVVEKIVPILQHEYISTVFEEVYFSLKDNILPASLQEFYLQITEFDHEIDKIKALIFLDKYEELREELFAKVLLSYPVIRDKIMKLYEMRNDASQFASSVNKYGKRVRWHLYRLYRVRNAIVHSGETHRHMQVLGEHLHIYVDAVLSDILFKFACEESLFTISDVLIDVRFSLQRKLASCTKSHPIDEQIIQTLSETLFCSTKSDDVSNESI